MRWLNSSNQGGLPPPFFIGCSYALSELRNIQLPIPMGGAASR